MTEPTIALSELLEKGADVDLLRQMIQFVAQRIMELDVEGMGMTGISKSQVSRLASEIDECVHAFLDRPIEGDWPYLWIDATYGRPDGSSRSPS